MKEIRRNMRLIGTLILCLFIGTGGWFGYTAFTQGSRWAMSGYNTRLNNAKKTVAMGAITDRDGYVLAYTDDSGERQYSSDMSIRLAVSQTVGDTMSMSGTGVQTFFASALVGMSGSIIDRTWSWLSGETTRGDDIQLTVDAQLSGVIARSFPSGYNGAAVVMNYKTGEILAMVSMPEYDPAGLGTDVADTAYLNRCLQGLYTPGSVFKIVTLTAALDNLPGLLNRTFTCTGSQDFGGAAVTCLSGRKAHGEMDLKSAFAQSCNVTFAELSYELGKSNMQSAAENFGFNDNFSFSDIVLYNSSYPEDVASVNELAWSGVGQGRVLVTPLHMAMIASSVANGGVMMEPKLVRQITGAAGIPRLRTSGGTYRRVMSEATAQIVGEYMRETVENGTGKKARVSGYTVCGKTGSAETSNDKSVSTNAWFVGYIQDASCPYAVAVVLEQAGSGGDLAATLAAKCLAEAVELVGGQG